MRCGPTVAMPKRRSWIGRRSTSAQVLGPEHPDTINSMNNLEVCLIYLGRYPEAEKLGRETLDLRRRVLGQEHPQTLNSMSNLATFSRQNTRQVAHRIQGLGMLLP